MDQAAPPPTAPAVPLVDGPLWLERFQPFTLTHGVVIVVAAIATIGIVRARRPLKDSSSGRRMDLTLAWLGILHWLAYNAYGIAQVLNDGVGKYTWEYALPLQICDLASLIGPLAWLTNRRLFSTLLYFWGLGLSSQAFLTPVVTRGPAYPEFFMFFIAHWFIVGGAIYEFAARGYCPRVRDLLIAIAAGVVYLAITLPINLVWDTNFGYTGAPQPGAARTLADALGAWPLRIVWIALLAMGAMALVLAPWLLIKRRGDTLEVAA